MKPSVKLKIAGILDIVAGSVAVVIALILPDEGIRTLNIPGGAPFFS